MNIGFAVASALSLFTWAVHTFVGGPEVARPLLSSDLGPVPKLTQYYCWHVVTLALFFMAAGFGYASAVPSGIDVAVFLTALSLAFALWSVLLIVVRYRRPLRLPQWILFFSIVGAAAGGFIPASP